MKKPIRPKTNDHQNNQNWWVYILRCADNSLYTGITTDIQRRLNEHNSADSKTRYTRSRQPVELVYQENLENRASASSREYAIKKLNRAGKIALIKKTRDLSR